MVRFVTAIFVSPSKGGMASMLVSLSEWGVAAISLSEGGVPLVPGSAVSEKGVASVGLS